MERGWTKRWRKRWDAGYHRDPLLWTMMDYLIDHANHEDKQWFDGKKTITIKRGQYVTSQPKLAEIFGAGRQQIRARLAIMESIGFSTNKATKRYSIITVCNYGKYQANESAAQPSNQPRPNQDPTTTKELKNLRSKESAPKKRVAPAPADLSEKIQSMKNRYQDPDLIDQAFEAIASTRKTGKVADSVLFRQLEAWGKYPARHVEAGIRIYLDKDYAAQGKNEKYLQGIIRNESQRPPADTCDDDPGYEYKTLADIMRDINEN